MSLWERLLITLVLARTCWCNPAHCPERCLCDNVGTRWTKVHCGSPTDTIYSITDIDFGDIASTVVQLNLSSNHLTDISIDLKLPLLRKLDASHNRISVLESDVFIGVPDLKQLDLSHNLLTTIKRGTVEKLTSLKQIDISNNPLVCDCELLWVSDWLQNRSVKFLYNPKCSLPKSTKRLQLKKIKKHGAHIECEVDEERGVSVALRPTEDQIAFEGDPLRLTCAATGRAGGQSTLSWSRLDKNVEGQFGDVINKYSNHGNLLNSSLYISKLSRNHTGRWTCRLNSHNVNVTRTILVIVISNVTSFCPVTVSSSNRGVYIWPETISGYTVDLPCEVNGNYKAYHRCTDDGQWREANISSCPYVSEITRILEQFSKVDLALTKVNVFDSANHLKNYTLNATHLRDKMDVVFIARTVKNYLNFLGKEKDVAQIVAEIVSNVQQVPRDLLADAEREDQSCRKIVDAVEVLGEQSSLSQSSFALQEYKIKRESFYGLTCTWYTEQWGNGARKNPELQCSTTNGSWAPTLGPKLMEASVQIPSSLLYQLQPQDRAVTSQRLFVGLFADSKLFPARSPDAAADVRSSVVGVKLVNAALANLSSPVHVMMRLGDDGAAVPVRWDPDLDGGRGGWSPNGCRLNHYLHDRVLVFACDRLGYYAVLQGAAGPGGRVAPERASSGAGFRLAHPATYVGGCVLLACLLASVVAYLLCYPSIRMARRAKHCLVNTWIAIAWLCFTYTFGMYETEDRRTCRAVGLLVHYLTLSTLLWMCVAASDMYKRLHGGGPPAVVLTEDGLRPDDAVREPMLGMYLVGWGVALIVCGISGAVDIGSYASFSYCFLDAGPALGAVLVPAAALVLFVSACLLLVRCGIRDAETRAAQPSEGTQATEDLDLDLLGPRTPVPADRRGSAGSAASTGSSALEDGEHAPAAQLRAHLVVFVVYVLAWACAAASTAGLPRLTPYDDDLFNVLYAALSCALGAFVLFFYCVARSDVRNEWTHVRSWCRWRRRLCCCRSRSVSDAARGPVPAAHVRGSADTQTTSRSSSRSSSQPKSPSRRSNNNARGAARLNEGTGVTANVVDLVVLHRQQYRSNNAVPVYELSSMNGAEMFYNPHQIGVAKKFFRKQKRHTMKHNNLGTRHRDTRSVKSQNSDMSSGLFGVGCNKVNNTNIHVETSEPKHAKKNLNVLSDGYGEDVAYRDDRLSSSAVQQLMMGARKLGRATNKKPKMNTCYEAPHVTGTDNTRTVSQQCSLEYSSEALDMAGGPPDREAQPDAPPYVAKPKIYVNPFEGLGYAVADGGKVGSMRSSLSTSDVDELYSQIRQGRAKQSRRHTLDERHLQDLNAAEGNLANISSDNSRSETRL